MGIIQFCEKHVKDNPDTPSESFYANIISVFIIEFIRIYSPPSICTTLAASSRNTSGTIVSTERLFRNDIPGKTGNPK